MARLLMLCLLVGCSSPVVVNDAGTPTDADLYVPAPNLGAIRDAPAPCRAYCIDFARIQVSRGYMDCIGQCEVCSLDNCCDLTTADCERGCASE